MDHQIHITREKKNSKSRLLTLAALIFGVVGLAAFASNGNVPAQGTLLFETTPTTTPEEQEVMRAYISFIAEHGRQYATRDHANDRYQVFKKNYEQIRAHNKHEQVMPFVMGVNQFTDMTAEEFAALQRVEVPQALVSRTKVVPHVAISGESKATSTTNKEEIVVSGHVHSAAHYSSSSHHVPSTTISRGAKRWNDPPKRKLKSSAVAHSNDDDSDDDDGDYKREREFERRFEREEKDFDSDEEDDDSEDDEEEEYYRRRHDRENEKKDKNIPQYVNWFEKNAVSSPKDQSSCGSCWAFTTAATLEGLAVLSGKFKEAPTFSMQQLLDCDISNDGCNGGWMYKAYNYTATYGIMLYEDYPYHTKSDHDKCQYQKEKAVFKNVGMIQEKSMSNSALKKRVAKQPVGVGIYSNTKLQFYKGGVLTEEYLECSDPDNAVNHGVTVVGYGQTKLDEKESEFCDEYWIVRNSWGAKWGEKGFFKLCMDDTGADYVPYGTCQLNRYPTYPTMDQHQVDLELFI